MSEAMAPSLALIVAGAVLAGAGVYLMLARSIVRMLLGFILDETLVLDRVLPGA